MQAFGIDPAFWRARRVFVTGHTGFVGGWLAFWLHRLGAEVCGYALAPPTRPSFFDSVSLGRHIRSITGDVTDAAQLSSALQGFRPDIVLHLAAQPLVRRAHVEPVESFATNVMGTANLMQALRGAPSVRAALIYTTDKVYENVETLSGYREDDRLGGREPYGASKACAEIVVDAFRHAYFPRRPGIATIRAGNIIGGGDWAEDRLVPDAIRAFAARISIRLRNPEAVRPWQHVLDPLRGTLLIAQALRTDADAYSGAWNLGPDDKDARTVADLADGLARHWGGGARWTGAGEPNGPYEAKLLTLSSEKAAAQLGWRPLWPLERSLAACVEWYRAHLEGADMETLTAGQIAAYEGAN